MMALENIENTEADSKSSPKRRKPGVKSKSKGTPLEIAPKKSRKRKFLQRRASEARN